MLKVLQYVGVFICVLTLILVGYFVSTRYIFFNLVSIDPNTSTISQYQHEFSFNYNKQLSKDSTVNSNQKDIQTIVKGKSIHIKLNETTLPENTVVSFSITAISNDKKIATERVFKVEYEKFNELTDSDQKTATKNSDSFSAFKLMSALPVRTADYLIDYTFPDSGSVKMPIIIMVKDFDYTNPPDSPANHAIYRKGRDAAILYLKTHGYTPEYYQLYFTEPYLLDEYGAKPATQTSYIYDPDATGAPNEIERKYPITESLPQLELSGPYAIDYSVDPTNNNKVTIEISNSTKEGRKAAIRWMIANNYDPTDYDIKFTDFKNPLTGLDK